VYNLNDQVAQSTITVWCDSKSQFHSFSKIIICADGTRILPKSFDGSLFERWYTVLDATGNDDPTRASPRHGDSLKGNTSSPNLPRSRGTKQFLNSSVASRAGDTCAQLVGEESWSDHGDADDTVDEYASEEDGVGSSEDEPYQSDISTTETAVTESFIARAAASPDALLESVAKFSSFVFTESFNGRAESTAMVFFASILGISTDGSTFERPLNYTPKLSALVYYARLCLLESPIRLCAKPLEASTSCWPGHIAEQGPGRSLLLR
jgi:hypothetical protein